MAGILIVDVEEMRAKATELNNKASEMDNIKDKMKSLVDSLQDVWKSDAGSEYVGNFNFIRGEVEDAITDLKNHIEQLNTSAKLYSDAEDDAITDVNGLSNSNIF